MALFRSSPRFRVVNSVLDLVGHTPCVNLTGVLPACCRDRGVKLYGKLEYFNPGGSVKDRLALAMVLDAEKRGVLHPGVTVLEPTSGNTGISLAMVCAKRGYPFVAIIAEPYSIDRRKIMRAFGAKVVLTPRELAAMGMVTKALELREAHGWLLLDQMSNPANHEFHSNTTGPEILSDFAGRRLDYWVTGSGSGGTFTGAGLTLKAARPDIKIILAEPENAPLVHSGIPQKRTPEGIPSEGHPSWKPHVIQGWNPNFIPGVLQHGLDRNVRTAGVRVTDEESLAMARTLATTEGVFSGVSGGASVAAALKVAREAEDGAVILAMIADWQERYQSSVLFEKIPEGMTPEEVAISKSTPSCHIQGY